MDVELVNAAPTGQIPTTRDASLNLLEVLSKQFLHCNLGLHFALLPQAVHQFQLLMILQKKLYLMQLKNLVKKKLLFQLGSMNKQNWMLNMLI